MMIALLLSASLALAAQDHTQRQQPRHATTAGQDRRPTLSFEELEAEAKRHPDDPKGWVLLGLAYLDRNEYPRALESFQHAVQVGPGSAEAHNWLGVALAEKSDLPGAIAEFRKAVSLDPKYGRAYSNLGSTLAQSGDYLAAVQVFKQGLALEPNSIGAHLNLGASRRQTRRTRPSSTRSARRSRKAATAPARSPHSSGRSRLIRKCGRPTTRSAPS